jgi:5,10-methylenetetrahydromethanopterin reductase
MTPAEEVNTMARRLGIMFDGFDPSPEMVETVRRAEDVGADSVWIAEHMGFREAVACSAAFAATTSRIRLIPTAISPYMWHPVPTAMSFATLAELAPGRIGVAVAVGNLLNLKESGHQPVKPVRAIGEFIEDLKALWTGEPVSRTALTYSLDDARMMFAPPEPIPIYVASSGPKVLGLAGRIADGVLMSAGLCVPYTERCLGWAEDGRIAAGRPAEAISRAGFVFCSVSPDGVEAREELRRKLAFLFRNERQAGNIADSGVEIDLGAIIDAVAKRDFETATSLVPDEAIDAFGVAGSPAACRDGLERYLATGLDEVILHISGTPENRALALEIVGELSGR